MTEPDLGAQLEALLIVADEPISAAAAAALIEADEPSVDVRLRELADEYTRQGRGFELRESSEGWRFYSRASCADVVTRFVTDGQNARLSQAALETLAVIAYRQPVTRSQIGAVRGVNVDAVVRTLMNRGLVEQVATDPLTGAGRYGTTPHFLERLGIQQLDDLPPLGEHVPIGPELAELIEGQS